MTTTEKINLIGQYHTAQANYEKSLELIRALKNYEISLQEVRLVDGGWNIVPAPELPEPIAQRLETAEANGNLKE